MNVLSMYGRHEKADEGTRSATEGIRCGGEECDARAATGGMSVGAWG
jgi:hypothetical protein